MPNLVPARVVGNAFSLETIAFQIGAFLGPTLSGVLIDRFGIAPTYFVSLFATALMVVALGLLRDIKQNSAEDRPKRLDWRTIQEGITFTFQQPLILSGMLLDFLATLFTRADTLMPIIARDILGVGPIAYGWLSAAQSIGATFAGITMSLFRQVRRQGVVLLSAVTMVGFGTLAFGLSREFALAMAALMVVGASDSISSIIRNTIRQLHTPDHIRGRMTSVNQMFFMGGPQLGEVKSGLFGQWIGVPLTIALGGIACVLSVGWIARRWPVLRTYNQHESTTAIA